MTTLKTRPEFLRAAAGRKFSTPGLLLQTCPTPSEKRRDDAIRVGFTASRKVGNAVARNRAKRRLRALAREILPRAGRGGHDYVLVARGETVVRPFAALRADLEKAIGTIHIHTRRPRREGP